MGILDHFTHFLRNLYTGQEATIRIGHGTRDWLKTGKGVHQGCILSPCLFNLYAEYIIGNAGLDDTSWNQDCLEKYRQPQTWRWYHFNGRKDRRDQCNSNYCEIQFWEELMFYYIKSSHVETWYVFTFLLIISKSCYKCWTFLVKFILGDFVDLVSIVHVPFLFLIIYSRHRENHWF